jgi:hypothetical protein
MQHQSKAKQRSSNNQACPLLDLCAELRNLIYFYAIPETVDIKRTSTVAKGNGLLGACRQLRSEVLQLYYSEAVFRCSASSDAEEFLEQLAKGDALQHLRYLDVFSDKVASGREVRQYAMSRIRGLEKRFMPHGLKEDVIRMPIHIATRLECEPHAWLQWDFMHAYKTRVEWIPLSALDKYDIHCFGGPAEGKMKFSSIADARHEIESSGTWRYQKW